MATFVEQLLISLVEAMVEVAVSLAAFYLARDSKHQSCCEVPHSRRDGYVI